MKAPHIAAPLSFLNAEKLYIADLATRVLLAKAHVQSELGLSRPVHLIILEDTIAKKWGPPASDLLLPDSCQLWAVRRDFLVDSFSQAPSTEISP